MSVAQVVPCDCCKDLVEAEVAVFEPDLVAHVCHDCRRQLQWAKAHLACRACEAACGVPSMPINIRGVYRGQDAPDNQTDRPPHAEH
jgi:hypothetical protein